MSHVNPNPKITLASLAQIGYLQEQISLDVNEINAEQLKQIKTVRENLTDILRSLNDKELALESQVCVPPKVAMENSHKLPHISTEFDAPNLHTEYKNS